MNIIGICNILIVVHLQFFNMFLKNTFSHRFFKKPVLYFMHTKRGEYGDY